VESVVELPAGAELASVLLAAERELVAVAGIEDLVRRARGAAPVVLLPSPVAGRVALAALFRVWDCLGEQLQVFGQPASGPLGAVHCYPCAPRRVTLPVRDVTLLRAAAAALADPTPELARMLAQHPTGSHVTGAVARLVALLDPSDAGPPPSIREANRRRPARSLLGDAVSAG
jgi:hypothetical protein